MQTVSENWKSVHKQALLNESYVEVSLDIADPDSLADASSVILPPKVVFNPSNKLSVSVFV